MSSSREESPDWLRSFQPPSQSAICLSSGSESPVSEDEDDINLSRLFKKQASPVPGIEDGDVGGKPASNNTHKKKSPERNEVVKLTPGRKRKNADDSEKKGKTTKGKDTKRKIPVKQEEPHEEKHSILALSSDSESSADTIPTKKDKSVKKESLIYKEDQITENEEHMNDVFLDQDGENQKNRASKVKSPRKKLQKVDEKKPNEKNVDTNNEENDDNDNVVKEDVLRNHPGPQASSSRLPLLLSEKVQRTKALVECEGDAIDLSGDVGAVGRVVISDSHSKNHDMLLDLKGTIYKTTIVPSRTFCVVSFGQSEAKIEAIMNDYIQLKPQSNVYEAETMVEGTLDGFSFDSEDDADNQAKAAAQADQHEVDEEQPKVKKKGKAEKTTGAGKNKGKAAGGKPPKKVKKKSQVPKKGKTKK